jgi:hypothetical protein
VAAEAKRIAKEVKNLADDALSTAEYLRNVSDSSGLSFEVQEL